MHDRDAADRLRDGGVPRGVNGGSFNPFENAGAMAAVTSGSGTVVEQTETSTIVIG